MSIAGEITRLQGAKEGLATAISGKGVTVPADAKLDAYPALVDDIDTSEYARPADWIKLPDLEHETEFKIAMLLHIPEHGAAVFGFNMMFSSLEVVNSITVDWGDGTTESYDDDMGEEGIVGEIATYHKYHYAAINAPAAANGDKQVIVTVYAAGGSNIESVYVESSLIVNLTDTIYITPSILREVAVQAGAHHTLEFGSANSNSMFGFYGYGIRSLDLKSDGATSLKRVVVKGSNFNSIGIVGSGPLLLDIPTNNQYTRAVFNSSAISELIFGDLSKLASTSFSATTTCGALRRCVVTGLTKNLFLTGNGMGRAELIELFQSLGTTSATARLNNSPGTAELTDADKAIATQKGWTLTL